MRTVSCTVPSAYDGQTVEAVLRGVLGASCRCVRRAKQRPDGILLDGQPAWTPLPVRAGQELRLAIDDAPDAPERSVPPQPGPVCVRYEDDDLLLVDKPADLVMYPGPGHPDGTLTNYLRQYFIDHAREGYPHAVNRIDRSTTGLVAFATTSFAKERLARQLHTNAFQRDYLALCEGAPAPAEGTVEAPIARLEEGRIGFGVDPAGKPAVTHYRVLGTFPLMGMQTASLVHLCLETGRTHQIRLHMAHLGCPLLGDVHYGRPSAVMPRAALHSWKAALDHPLTGERILCTAPLPGDMRALVPQEFLSSLK